MFEDVICLLHTLPYLVKIRLMECIPYLLKCKLAEIDAEMSNYFKKQTVEVTRFVCIKIEPNWINDKYYSYSDDGCSTTNLKKIIDARNCFPAEVLIIYNEVNVKTTDLHDPLKFIIEYLFPNGLVAEKQIYRNMLSFLL